jgi:hypothetical protein
LDLAETRGGVAGVSGARSNSGIANAIAAIEAAMAYGTHLRGGRIPFLNRTISSSSARQIPHSRK